MVGLHRMFWSMMVMGSWLMGGSYHRCYAYRADDILLTPPESFARMILVVPRDWDVQDTHPMVLLLTDRSGREERMSQYLMCDHNLTQSRGRYRCGGECDAGEVWVGTDKSLSLDTPYPLEVDIPAKPYEEETRTELHLKPGISSAKAHAVPCPLYVERLYNPERPGARPEDPLLNVCYTHKSTQQGTTHYQGCFLTPSRCATLHRQHFGHYPDEARAYRGFLRCVDSRPHAK